jgi:acyl dehydratase
VTADVESFDLGLSCLPAESSRSLPSVATEAATQLLTLFPAAVRPTLTLGPGLTGTAVFRDYATEVLGPRAVSSLVAFSRRIELIGLAARDMRQVATSSLVGVRNISRGVFIEARIDGTYGGGQVAVQRSSGVVLGARNGCDLGKFTSERDKAVANDDHPARRVSRNLGADLPLRFAEWSGEDELFHVSRNRALAMGYPGVVLQATCVMAEVESCALELSEDLAAPTNLRWIDVRFHKAVCPPAVLTFTGRQRPEESGVWDFTGIVSGSGVVCSGAVSLQTHTRGNEP